MIPSCFYSQEQWDTWRELARMTKVNANKAGYCIDCLPDYQAAVLEEGLCAHPEIIFGIDKHGFVTGYLPTSTVGYVSIRAKRMNNGI